MANKLWIGTDGNYGTNANWSPTNVPIAGDHVRIPRGGGNISSGLDQSAVAIGDFIVEEGYTGTIGSAAGYLKIDPDRFVYAGTGEAYINLGTAAIAVDVMKTASASVGYSGLYLLGTAITVLNVGGTSNVGLASSTIGEVSTVTTAIRTTGTAKVYLGSGVTLTSTSIDMQGGEVYTYSTIDDAQLNVGTLTLLGAAAADDLEIRGGTLVHNSSGTIDSVTIYSGRADWQQCGLARTVTTITYYGGSLWLNPNAVTLTNKVAFPEAVRISA